MLYSRFVVIKNIFNNVKLFKNYIEPRTKLIMNNFATKATAATLHQRDIEVDRIVWIDLEMTGLEVEKCGIMEIACLITDSDLNIIAEGPNITINQSADTLNNMNEWCTLHHGKTGLTEACTKSTYTTEKAENEVLNFVAQHVTKGASPLAGNSVYMDRMFLMRYMPRLNEYLHYRIIDVSTVKELCRRWNKTAFKQAPKKEFVHRAMADIKESVAELKYYKETFLNFEQL